MGFFTTPTTPLYVPVDRFIVRVSRCTENGDDDPTYGPFVADDRLAVKTIFYGSSVAGPSYAKLRWVQGRPHDDPINPEAIDVLRRGDRVIVSIDGGAVLFGGYMTQAELAIEEGAESLVYRCDGPEWLWGANAGGGSIYPVVGQLRRLHGADADGASGFVTTSSNMEVITAERAHFNPGNRANMSSTDVNLLDAGTGWATVVGRCWEQPDRTNAGSALTAMWTVDQAAKVLLAYWNDPDATGILPPDFTTLGSVLGTTKPIRDVDVDGLGLWDALGKALGPQLAFYVDPRPSAADTWGGFTVHFFDRSNGAAADFWLDPRGTRMTAATPSVRRIHAAQTTNKVINRVSVLGNSLRHLVLKFGDVTTYAPTKLQKGWPDADGELTTFQRTADTGSGNVVDEVSVQQANYATWKARYCTTGAEFQKYHKVFRYFTWNESAELGSPWLVPDLTGIADDEGFNVPQRHAGKYVRRRRPMLDTQYYVRGLEQWQRIKPTLWIAARFPSGVEPVDADYQRVPDDKWQPDPQRCAFYITEPDLATWTPFYRQNDPVSTAAADMRTFASLLLNDQLRFKLECSVETDWCMAQTAERGDGTGSPHVRQATVRAERDFIKSVSFIFSETSPLGAGFTAAPVDQSAEALLHAENLRDAGENETVHASILATSTWSLQNIGALAGTFGGRNISLSNSGGKGAQIVALQLDCEAMAAEYLTESAAMELRQLDRLRIVSRRKENKGETKGKFAERPAQRAG